MFMLFPSFILCHRRSSIGMILAHDRQPSLWTRHRSLASFFSWRSTTSRECSCRHCARSGLGSTLEDNLPMGTVIENRQTDESVAVDMFVFWCLSDEDNLRRLNWLCFTSDVRIVRKSAIVVWTFLPRKSCPWPPRSWSTNASDHCWQVRPWMVRWSCWIPRIPSGGVLPYVLAFLDLSILKK